VPPSVLEDDQQLASWAKRAAEIQGRKRTSPKKKTST